MTRKYKANRRFAPPLVEILAMRQLGDSMPDIADRYGCHRRTAYAALDRAARAGRLPPVMIPVLFPDDVTAQQRMAGMIGLAHNAGVRVTGWEHIAVAKAMVASGPAA